jgi:hypothetical protein
MPPTEVFLSHASADGDMAARITRTLVTHNVPVFYSPRNIAGAQQWQDEILHALRRCEWFLVLLSPDAVGSMWVRREFAFALSERRYEHRIVPLAYRPCDLGPFEWLRNMQTVDFAGDFDAASRELLRIWGLGLRA